MKLKKVLPKRRKALLRNPLPGFDPVYYRYWYRDVLAFTGGPLEHYLRHGWKEGRDPSAGFSTLGYLSANPDIKASGLNPLIHFLECGLAEGRGGWQKSGSEPAPPPRVDSDNPPLKLLSPPKA